MSELTLTLLRLGFLALLWLLVLSVVAVLRRDLFGTRVTRRAPVTTGPMAAAPPRTMRCGSRPVGGEGFADMPGACDRGPAGS